MAAGAGGGGGAWGEQAKLRGLQGREPALYDTIMVDACLSRFDPRTAQ